MDFTPKDPKVTISELGTDNRFIDGTVYHYIDWAKRGVKTFKKGVTVSWKDIETRKTYRGKIEWMIIIDGGDIQVSIDKVTPEPNFMLGRLPLSEIW